MRTRIDRDNDQRALDRARSYLNELKADRALASDNQQRELISEQIREQSRLVRQLESWIDGVLP